MRQRYYIAEKYNLDRFCYDTRVHKPRGRLSEPSDESIRTKKLPAAFKWETEAQFRGRAERDTKQGAGYYGLGDWEPAPWDDQRDLWAWFLWFDVRRMVCVAVAVAVILVHVMLMA